MSFLLTALIFGPLALPRGEIIDSVKCVEDETQSYALYLPPTYCSEKKWPILLALDPGGRGKMPLQAFEQAAQEYGYILAGSNNSRNGPMDSAIYALNSMWSDTKRRFSIDTNRVYLAGFSGGVRVAGKFAQDNLRVHAVIGCGAGFDIKDSDVQVPFTFVGACGTEDMNYMWLKTLNAQLLKNKTHSRVIVFDGGHHWPSNEICRQAVQWLELDSYRRGRRPIDRALIEQLYQSERTRAETLSRSGKLFEAYLIQLDLRADLRGLRDLEEVRKSIRRLEGTDELRASWKKAQQLEQKESRHLKKILAEFLDTKRRRNTAWWETRIREIKNLEKENPSHEHRQMVARLMDSLWRNGYERAWLATLSKDYETAVYFAEISVLALPDSPEILYNLARMYALNNQREEAVHTLERASQAGLNNVGRVEQDDAFYDLRSVPEFQKILDRIKAP